MATTVQVTFDCADPDRLATFWASALGYRKDDPPEGYESWEAFLKANGVPEEWNSASAIIDPDGVGPRIYFQRVPEPKTVKNRLHLDVNVGGGRGTPAEERRRRVYAEVDRLAGEGATKMRVHDDDGEFWVVMTDPEGNEFCLQ